MSDLETGLDRRWHGEGFLWSDSLPRARFSFHSQISPAYVLAVAQDYARHNETYKPEVASALVRSHTGNDFSVFMRIVKSKFFRSDVLNTGHEIHFIPVDAKRVYSRAYTTRVAEVTDPGTPREHDSRSARIEACCGDCSAIGSTKNATAALSSSASPSR